MNLLTNLPIHIIQSTEFQCLRSIILRFNSIQIPMLVALIAVQCICRKNHLMRPFSHGFTQLALDINAISVHNHFLITIHLTIGFKLILFGTELWHHITAMLTIYSMKNARSLTHLFSFCHLPAQFSHSSRELNEQHLISNEHLLSRWYFYFLWRAKSWEGEFNTRGIIVSLWNG